MKRLFVLVLVVFFAFSVARADMEVHFLNVGQGDCTILIADGEAMIIDGGSAAWSRKVFSYISSLNEVKGLRYMVATHPHEDHVGGLPAVMNAVPVETILTPVLEADLEAFQDLMRYAKISGSVCLVPNDGDQFTLGNAVVIVLICWPEAWSVNDMSIVLRVDYGETSFLFTGDAEYTLEYMLLDAVARGDALLQADVLKVAHHGSDTSSTEEFVQAVSPEFAVISCGKKNVYLHPKQNTLNTLTKSGAKLFRTDLQGTILFHTDGQNIRVTTEKKVNNDSLLRAPESSEIDNLPDAACIGNRKTLKFHTPFCEYGKSISPGNRILFDDREEAAAAGFSPCGFCNP